VLFKRKKIIPVTVVEEPTTIADEILAPAVVLETPVTPRYKDFYFTTNDGRSLIKRRDIHHIRFKPNTPPDNRCVIEYRNIRNEVICIENFVDEATAYAYFGDNL
jgi:hypothetical protein